MTFLAIHPQIFRYLVHPPYVYLLLYNYTTTFFYSFLSFTHLHFHPPTIPFTIIPPYIICCNCSTIPLIIILVFSIILPFVIKCFFLPIYHPNISTLNSYFSVRLYHNLSLLLCIFYQFILPPPTLIFVRLFAIQYIHVT